MGVEPSDALLRRRALDAIPPNRPLDPPMRLSDMRHVAGTLVSKPSLSQN